MGKPTNDNGETERTDLDPELRLMGQLNRELGRLEPEARQRVLSYLMARHLAKPVCNAAPLG